MESTTPRQRRKGGQGHLLSNHLQDTIGMGSVGAEHFRFDIPEQTDLQNFPVLQSIQGLAPTGKYFVATNENTVANDEEQPAKVQFSWHLTKQVTQKQGSGNASAGKKQKLPTEQKGMSSGSVRSTAHNAWNVSLQNTKKKTILCESGPRLGEERFGGETARSLYQH
ncbi:hypothetical protein R1sor_002631 [Riccia sorocarpa]|uniref:Uncharacterized protein n=1 Tax=Riccia sorocarpa TaxID=122646 RepID=A0ABD3H3A3_9MARC